MLIYFKSNWTLNSHGNYFVRWAICSSQKLLVFQEIHPDYCFFFHESDCPVHFGQMAGYNFLGYKNELAVPLGSRMNGVIEVISRRNSNYYHPSPSVFDATSHKSSSPLIEGKYTQFGNGMDNGGEDLSVGTTNSTHLAQKDWKSNQLFR